jgi:ethanolaminephosphotransferase
MFNVIPHIWHWYYYDEPSVFYGDFSSNFTLFIGVSFIIYHICDNSDGKQARRTGSSSPLGMLFDHGADCLTTLVNYAFVARIA